MPSHLTDLGDSDELTEAGDRVVVDLLVQRLVGGGGARPRPPVAPGHRQEVVRHPAAVLLDHQLQVGLGHLPVGGVGVQLELEAVVELVLD